MSSVSKLKIRSKDLVVRFGDVLALNSFSAGIPQNVVGLLGPNGAGKTTFIKVALGLLEPDRGSIEIDGLSPDRDLSRLRDNIGYMPESECLPGSMDAVDLVSYLGKISGMRSRDAIRRAHEVLDFVGLDEERYREISSYSTGMKQRVKLAQCIVHDPNIMFLDEPTNGMDPEGREEMLSLIRKIGESGKTLLISSHLLKEVEQVAQYVLIINEGSLLKAGSLEDILKGDENQYELKVRGEKGHIERFKNSITQKGMNIAHSRKEAGQETLVLENVKNSRDIFGFASDLDVQIRSYKRDILSLEEVFLRAFEEKEKGNEKGGELDGS